MGDKSKISWTDATWNPVTGCSPVSAGCANCYAKRMSKRLAGRAGYPADEPFRVTVHEDRFDQPLRWTRSRMIFVCSMGDLFHDEVSDVTLTDLFSIMASSTEHIFLLLTKRPRRMRDFVRSVRWLPGVNLSTVSGRNHILPLTAVPNPTILGGDEKCLMDADWVPPNIWCGITAENQAMLEARAPDLLETPAAKRFVSYEPAIGPLDAEKYLQPTTVLHMRADVKGMLRNCAFDSLQHTDGREMSRREAEETLLEHLADGVKFIPVGSACDEFTAEDGCPGHRTPGLDWVIAGGESGPGARPAHPDWFRSIRDQCVAAGVPFHFKQHGEWCPVAEWICREKRDNRFIWRGILQNGEEIGCEDIPEKNMFVWHYGDHEPANDSEYAAVRVGKKTAGRELDGRTWDEMPSR